MMTTISDLRPSPIAGRWYSADPEQLSGEIDRYLDDAELPNITGEVVALVVPHAGHVYSGETAGTAFASVRGKSYPRVALLSPLHDYHPAPFITSAHKGYQTPLGKVWIHSDGLVELDQAMKNRGLPGLTAVARDREHSQEIELPFLQRALDGPFELLPIMVRSHEADELKALGEALAETLKKYPALLVASTDLSHFYPLAVAERLDATMLARIAEISPEGVLAAEEAGTGFACGAGGLAAMLWAARALGANAAQVVRHSTSAEQTGDTTSVVGYGAAVILKKA